MNCITFDGRVVADAELRHTPGGESVLGFRVASDISFGDRKTTNWFQCQMWGKRGEALEPFLKKGQQVTVYGQLTLREWDNKGVKQLSPDIRCHDVTLQGSRPEGSGSAPARAATPAPAARQSPAPAANKDFEDDIPF